MGDRHSKTSALLLLVFLPFSLLFLFTPLSIALFQPADKFLLACGAAAPTAVRDGRVFLPDSTLPAAHRSTALSTVAAPPLYRTARVFPGPSSYHFRLRAPSTAARAGLLLRLHFQPFPSPSPSPSLNLSAALFNVSAAGAPLLSLFSPAQASAPRPLIKEFFLKPKSSSLHLAFSPAFPSTFAFINAIELFSAPDRLFSDAFTPIPTLFSLTNAPLSNHLLETLYRINVGGPAVTPENDTLWRTWEPDDEYLETPSRAKGVAFSGEIKYPDGGATRETAPEFVYGNARVMNEANSSNSYSSPPDHLNISWSFPVPNSIHGYLVRLHFCDIASSALNELYLNVYINGYSAYKDLDLSAQSGYTLASPYYVDFVLVDRSRRGSIDISVGPSERSLPGEINALLNGVEIMKMNGAVAFSKEDEKRMHLGIAIASFVGSLILVCGLAVLVHVIKMARQRKPKDQMPRLRDDETTWSPLPEFTGNSYCRVDRRVHQEFPLPTARSSLMPCR